MKPSIIVYTFLLALCLSGCAAKDSPTSTDGLDSALISMGEDIARTACASCHNVEHSGTSPRSDAPPLRVVLNDLNLSALADDFREHLHVGHPDMPDFEFTVKETDSLMAYLVMLQDSHNRVK